MDKTTDLSAIAPDSLAAMLRAAMDRIDTLTHSKLESNTPFSRTVYTLLSDCLTATKRPIFKYWMSSNTGETAYTIPENTNALLESM